MKNILIFIFTTFTITIAGQNMTNQRLNEIYTSVSDSIQGRSGAWQFQIKDVVFISLTDSINNRMRIISPVIEEKQLDTDLLKASLIANFHTALDVKYAISDGVLWASFIHPLKELSDEQIRDAISQVYYANVNFGTTFASTSLVFPGGSKEKEKEKPKNKLEKRKI